MLVKSAKDIGLALSSRRRFLGLTQAELARRVGVTRRWVIGVEKGKGSVELELVLRAAGALGLVLDLRPESGAAGSARTPEADIDAIVAKAKSRPS
jgi:HTH-type transcriptional regulator/antitoxin HipB